MIKTAVGFFKSIGALPKPWWAWIGLLMFVNLVAPLFFLGTPEGKVVLVTFFLAAGTQMAIFRAKGFVRLLGLGHVFWVPLEVWLVLRLGGTGVEGAFRIWVLSVVVSNGLSLVIDAVDLVRYWRGEREPTVVPNR